jgi:hypothetical protein
MILLDTKLIDDLDRPGGLYRALQRAIELEHATLPTYLYSFYSLGNDNREIASLILSVILEEMLHFALACNTLNAIGGSPDINKPNFIPKFPGHLPGGVEAGLRVHLKRFSREHVHKCFMVIEEPEHPLNFKALAAVKERLTIGEYYTRIEKKIEEQGQGIFTGKPERQVTGGGFPPSELFTVKDVATAIQAIEIIKQQGEGTTRSPLDPQHEYAHYYRFAEIWHLHELEPVPNPPPDAPDDEKYRYNGPPIPFDESKVLPVIDDPAESKYPRSTQAHYLNDNFNYAYTSLLNALHLTFNGQPNRLESAIALMHSLRELAMEMMTIPVGGGVNAGPSFEYLPVNP